MPVPESKLEVEASFTAVDRIDFIALASFLVRKSYSLRLGGAPEDLRNIIILTRVELGTDIGEVSDRIREELEAFGIKVL